MLYQLSHFRVRERPDYSQPNDASEGSGTLNHTVTATFIVN